MLSILKVACAQVACAQVAWSSKLRVLKVACPQCLMVLGSAPFPFSDNICKGVFCIYPVNNVWPFPYCNNQPDLVCHCCWEFAKHASSPCSGQCLTRLRKEQSASSPSHHVGGACQTDTRVAEGIPPGQEQSAGSSCYWCQVRAILTLACIFKVIKVIIM